MFICGSASFNHKEEKYEAFKNSNSNKNPYAGRGLDKFYALLSDLDDKKQKIYTQLGAEEISFVRFVYDSDQVKPIIVKVKGKKANMDNINPIKRPEVNLHEHADRIHVKAKEKDGLLQEPLINHKDEEYHERNANKETKRCPIVMNGMNLKLHLEDFNLRQPYNYLLVMVLLIMVFLAIFGRSFAIFCTSIGWYLVPRLSRTSNNNNGKSKRTTKKAIAKFS